jgi:hypothetical protein
VAGSSKEGCGSKRAVYFADDDEGDVLIKFTSLADHVRET